MTMIMTPTTAIRPDEDFTPSPVAGTGVTPCEDMGVLCDGRSGVRDAPQDVQNFRFGSTAAPHEGQNRKMNHQ